MPETAAERGNGSESGNKDTSATYTEVAYTPGRIEDNGCQA
ncbi:hypothetical protein [Marinobacter vulgaris]|nr:hypothetical protein [Marinobacter vulgaris]